MTAPKMMQGGVSAIAAMDYLRPVVQNILDKSARGENTPSDIEAESKSHLAKLSALPDDELNLLGHNLTALTDVAELMTMLVGIVALTRMKEKASLAKVDTSAEKVS